MTRYDPRPSYYEMLDAEIAVLVEEIQILSEAFEMADESGMRPARKVLGKALARAEAEWLIARVSRDRA